MKTLLATIFAIVFFLPMAIAQDNGRIKVTVLDEKGEAVIGAVVRIVAGGPLTGSATGVDGTCMLAGLTPGAYSVESNFTGYKSYTKQGVQVSAGQTAYITYNMVLKNDTLPVVKKIAYRGPADPTFSTIKSINADEVKRMAGPRGDIAQMVSGSVSDVSVGSGGQLVMRGAREGASQIYVDGEKMYGSSSVPALGISQVSVLSGGIPAEYGDLSGGAVIITTHTFYSGMATKERMYIAAAEKEVADSAAALEKSGKRVENNTEVIEKQDVPQGQEQPAPQEDPQPQPQGEQPKETVQPK
jgi:hypothetical protein